MARAAFLFVTAAALVVGTGWFARSVLHLDCLGPYIEGWGCLSAPYPAELPGSAALMLDLGLAVAGFLACLVLRDVVWAATALLARIVLAGRLPGRLRGRPSTASPRGYPLR